MSDLTGEFQSPLEKSNHVQLTATFDVLCEHLMLNILIDEENFSAELVHDIIFGYGSSILNDPVHFIPVVFEDFNLSLSDRELVSNFSLDERDVVIELPDSHSDVLHFKISK